MAVAPWCYSGLGLNGWMGWITGGVRYRSPDGGANNPIREYLRALVQSHQDPFGVAHSPQILLESSLIHMGG